MCQYKTRFPIDGVRVAPEIREAIATRAVADIELLDADEDLITRLDGYECVIDLSLNQPFCRNQLASPTQDRSVSALEPVADIETPRGEPPRDNGCARPRLWPQTSEPRARGLT